MIDDNYSRMIKGNSNNIWEYVDIKYIIILNREYE